jgi:hypothetical protein
MNPIPSWGCSDKALIDALAGRDNACPPGPWRSRCIFKRGDAPNIDTPITVAIIATITVIVAEIERYLVYTNWNDNIEVYPRCILQFWK